MDGSPIHIIKIKMVQVGGRHLRVSFLFYKKENCILKRIVDTKQPISYTLRDRLFLGSFFL
ncbi:hypothetical protein EXW48_05330 [Bacillus wiedmannii]|nr:hypothetical protein EXW48_05330 [Bacillus wiedmannii]